MDGTNVSPDNSILLWAANFGSRNQMLRLIEEGMADLNVTNGNGDTVLHLIFRNENFVERDVANLLKTFLDRGADPNAENKREETILHVAVANRMRIVVEVLISYGADIDKCDNKGNSITHLFVQDERNKFFELLKIDKGRSSGVEKMEDESASFAEFLIEKGFDFDRENKLEKSALQLTVEYNLQHILVVLLKHTQNIHFFDHKKLLLHLFLEKNYNFKYEHFNALKWYSGYTSRYATRIVKLLLEKGASAVAFDNFDETPLRMAIGKQETSIIETMIDHHLENCDDNTATIMFLELLKSCASWGVSKTEYFLTVLDNLITKGADVNTKDKNGMTSLFHAFHCKNRRAVDFLANRGADFSVSTEEAENLFHALAKKDPRVKSDDPTLETLFDLLANQNCCDLNAKNLDGETPLHLAAKSGNHAIVRKLIEFGAEVDCKNKYKETPLHLAVQCNQSEELVEYLLESGAEVDCKDISGRWPLFHAVDRARDDNPLVPLLLKWGASVNIRNGNQSAFFTAVELGCWCNARAMLAYGADINDERVVAAFQKFKWHEQYTKALFVLLHWIKLSVAELPCANEYRMLAMNHVCGQEYLRLYGACSREIETLKATLIDDKTSIYDFLHMHTGSRLVYVMNENLKKIIDCQNLKKHFPEYKDVILAAYREAVRWISMLELARRALLRFTDVKLPHECCALIFVHLEYQDLANIIECGEDV